MIKVISLIKKNTIGLLIIILLLLALISWFFFYLSHNRNLKPVYSVEVSPVCIKPMPVLIQAPAVVEADETVTVIPQVTGTILNMLFTEGQDVKMGQLLFELDPAPFLQVLSQAVATLQRDEATLEQNMRDAKRAEILAKKEYITVQQAEQAKTVAKAQKAVVDADVAAVHQAQIQLGYTKIYASIDGKTGNVAPQAGSLVVANTTPLVTLNNLDSILVNFNLTQSQLQTVLSQQKHRDLTVEVLYENEGKVITQGQLVFIDNTVNPQTGTILLKARISNKNRLLWPGMMVSVNLIIHVEEHAIVVPISAVKVDQKGNYLYTVENGKAVIKRIEISQEMQNEAVISKGLSGNETVILTIPPNFSEGSLVHILNEKTVGGENHIS